ncbi:MAG TPA: glycosyltransferase [Victivallales bacterium]|nr:glycosyltransferase [Victivallales bacterium]
MDKLISVVIPTYNRAELLSNTLCSLKLQTLNKDKFEVIVVDDGGSDNSREIVDSFKKDLNVKYFWHEDKGFRVARTRNVGIIHSEGEYIAFLDTGIFASSKMLESHLNLHLSSSHPTVSVGYMYGLGLTNKQARMLLSSLERYRRDPNKCIEIAKNMKLGDIRQYQFDILGENIHSWPAPFDLFLTGNICIGKTELYKVGMFDETFNKWGGEDVDLGIRLFQNNNVYILNRSACAIHWPHEKNSNSQWLSEAKRLHKKYNIWQTKYYELCSTGKVHPNISLNLMVKFIGPYMEENKMIEFIKLHKSQLDAKQQP